MILLICCSCNAFYFPLITTSHLHSNNYLIFIQTPYKQIKQREMYKSNTNNIKKNQRSLEQYHGFKNSLRQSQQNTDDPINRAFNTTYIFKTDNSVNQSATLFAYPHNYTLDIRKHKNNTDNVQQYRKKKSDGSAQQIYNQKKNAYKNYIREIYRKINEQLGKKNTFLSIEPHNLKQIDYSKVLITRQVKPSLRSKETQQNNLKKRLKQKLRLQKLHQQSASLQKVKNKFFIIKKANERKQKKIKWINNKNQRLQQSSQNLSKKSQSFQGFKQKLQKIAHKFEGQISHKKYIIEPQAKSKNFSLIVSKNANEINIQDFIPAKKILNKKDPFVCGLKSEKQGNQQKNKQKILIYIDFLWRVSYSIGLYAKSTPQQTIYKAYVGPGNNSIMLKSIIKRRYWWVISEKAQNCNLLWTQLKQNNIFKQLQKQSCNKKQNFYPFNVNLFMNQLQKNFLFQSKQNSFSLFNKIDNSLWQEHMSKNNKTQAVINERTFVKRAVFLSKKNLSIIKQSKNIIIHNHLQHNYFIGNKKALFYYMKKYYELNQLNIFDDLPLTFHIVKGIDDPEYKRFVNHYNKVQSIKKTSQDQKNIWIIKPGQYSNRGNGISVCHSLDDILIRLKSKQKSSDGNLRTFIVQKYIQKPLLYKNRKFDIRHYLLLTCFNGVIKAYWYPQGYIRTSSSQFTLKRGGNIFVHLTNDAIQKNSQQYGKYEKGNKISYQKFQSYLDKNARSKNQKNMFFDSIIPNMKKITINAVKATYLNLDDKKRQHNFELLGMDFMIDQNFKPWLIQINTNPCLELSCPLLSKLIPSVVQNTFKICVDPFFPPPQQWATSKKVFLSDNTFEQNKFELIFDESIEGRKIESLYRGDYKLTGNIGKIQQDAQIYQNDGLEEWQGEELKKQV